APPVAAKVWRGPSPPLQPFAAVPRLKLAAGNMPAATNNKLEENRHGATASGIHASHLCNVLGLLVHDHRSALPQSVRLRAAGDGLVPARRVQPESHGHSVNRTV